MMSMGIGINAQHCDEGENRRIQESIACGVWFTSNGNTFPKLIKFQDEEGNIRTISGIHVRMQEKKYYCGIPAVEYRCDTVVDGQEYLFRLYYYIETGCWKISWGD